MFVNPTVIKRQANFSYSKKYAQNFLLQAFFIIITFSHFKHQNYVSFTTRVSESIRCKVVALVSARAHCCGRAQNCIRSPALAKKEWAKLIIVSLSLSRPARFECRPGPGVSPQCGLRGGRSYRNTV